MNEIAEGFWDSERYQHAVELYNDGNAWHFDLFKIYFMGDWKDDKIVRCFNNKDGTWIHHGQHKIVK